MSDIMREIQEMLARASSNIENLSKETDKLRVSQKETDRQMKEVQKELG